MKGTRPTTSSSSSSSNRASAKKAATAIAAASFEKGFSNEHVDDNLSDDTNSNSNNNNRNNNKNNGNGMDEESGDMLEDGPLPIALQNFLSNVGVVGSSTAAATVKRTFSNMDTSTTSATNNSNGYNNNNNNNQYQQDESIFESTYDLTDERLKHVFTMFDTDHDGTISYKEFRRGMEIHTGGNFSKYIDETGFQHLMAYLDADGSGDITYQEFTDGIALLMLRPLVLQGGVSKSSRRKMMIQVMDYNAHRFEKYLVKRSVSSTTPTTPSSSPPKPTSIVQIQSPSMIHDLDVYDFYFKKRPTWVKTRWINVSGPVQYAASTMRPLAVKHKIHPLALEDALSPESQRPKAEVYSSHYFIMVPIFSIEPLSSTKSKKGSRRNIGGNNSNNDDYHPDGIKIGKIRTHMTSIFVNVPDNDTIITYNDTTGLKGRMAPGKENDTKNGMVVVDVNDSGKGSTISDNNTNSTVDCWLRVQRELGKSYSKLRQYDAQYLTYALLDRAVDRLDPIIKVLQKEITYQKQQLLQTHYDKTIMDRIHYLREELDLIVRKLKPFIRLLVHVIEDDAITPGATVYLRDVLDNLECHEDDVKHLIVACREIDVEAEKFHSSQMEQTLYKLTVISAIFLPAQFCTGLWGMNFTNMPELQLKWGYAIFWSIAITMSLTLLFILDFGRLRR